MIFYLHGSEKFGPYSYEEFTNLKLDSETLVYSEDWGSWQKLCDVPQLNVSLNEPIEKAININSPLNTKTIKKPIVIKPIYIYLILLIISIFISYILIYNKKSNCLEEIKIQTAKIFNGKNSIADYSINNLKNGKLYKLSQNKIKLHDKLSINSDEIGFLKSKTVYDTTGNNPKDTIFFKTVGSIHRFKKWNQIVDYFDNNKLTIYDGASLTLLRKKSETEFSFTRIEFQDMAYFVPEYKNYDYGYGYSGKLATYRPTIENAYKEAAEFIIQEEESKYEKGNDEKIYVFEDIENDLYEIGANLTYHDIYPIGDLYEEKLNRKHGYELFSFAKENSAYTYCSKIVNNEKVNFVNVWEDNIQITNNKYVTENANIIDSQTIVWYSQVTNNLVIIEKKNEFYKFLGIYAISIFIFLVIIFQILKNLKRFQLK
jgi:hypothetical protein